MSTPGKNKVPTTKSSLVRLSLFYDIAVEMGFEDEEPAHIHVSYEGKEAKVGFDNQVLTGWLPPICLEIVYEWISKHLEELEDAWRKCSLGEYPSPISPLHHNEPLEGPGHLYLTDIESVEAREGFRIWVRFEDGVCGEVDLSHLAGKGVFEAWLDRSFFESVSVNQGVVSWNETIDLDPCQLYMSVTGKTPEDIWPGFRPGRLDA